MVTCLSVSNCYLILCYLFSTLSYFFYFLLISVVTMPIASKQRRISGCLFSLFQTRAEKCVCSLQATLSTSTIVGKSLGTLSRLWGVSHRSNPSPHPTNNVGRVYREFFSEFQLCIRWGRENCKKIWDVLF